MPSAPTTPSSSSCSKGTPWVTQAAYDAFDAVKADGLKDDGGSGTAAEEKPDAFSDAKGDSSLARTGDDAPLGAVAAVGAAGGLAVLVAAARRSRASEKQHVRYSGDSHEIIGGRSCASLAAW